MANSNTSPKKHAPTSKKGMSTGSNTKGQPGNARGATTSTSTSNSTSTSTVWKKPLATTKSSETTLVISNRGKSDANRPVQKTVKVQEAEGPSKTDSERPREERQRRGFTFCMGVICCLIILLVLGLVLGLVVFGNDDNSNSNSNNSLNGGAPAPAPAGAGNNGGQTPSMPTPPQNNPVAPAPSSTTNNGNSSPIAPNPETSPVMSPTLPPSTPTPTPVTPGQPVAPVAPAPTSLLQPSPSQIIILPSADTFVYRNGFTPYEAYGTEDTFLVQNGPNGVNEIPDAVGLLGFDLSTSTGTLPSSYSQVVLQLYHQAASRNRGPATLTIRLLSSTPLAVETLHAGIFNPTDDEGTFGPTFTVSPSDTDITTLVRNQNQDEDQLFLMIENRGAEQGQGAEGDRFYTRETDDPPQLIVYI